MKRIVSFILAVAMIIGALPVGEMVAWAEDEPILKPFTFDSITVIKVFRDLYGPEKYSITITGSNFLTEKDVIRFDVGIMGDDGTIKAFTPIYKSNALLQYELKPEEISGNLYIDGKEVDIAEGEMPSITNKTPTTGIVDNTGDAEIKLIGSGFNNIDEKGITASLFQGNSNLPISKGTDDKEIISKELKGKTGIWSVQFKKVGKTDKLKKENEEDADLIIQHRYMDMFSLLNRLDVSDKIDLIPTQGPVESMAILQADNLKPENEMRDRKSVV